MRWLLVATGILAACSTGPSMVALVHPVTGAVRICSYDTVGNLAFIEDCARMWESLGYRRADTLTPQEKEQLLPAGLRTRPAPTRSY